MLSFSTIHSVGDAFMVAAAKGNVKEINAIIQQPYFNMIPAYYKEYALRYASSDGRYAVMSSLLDANCETSLPMNGAATCLMLAAANGHRNIVELLFEKKRDHFNLTQKKSALKLSIRTSHMTTATLLYQEIESEVGEVMAQAIKDEIYMLLYREFECSKTYLSHYPSSNMKNAEVECHKTTTTIQNRKRSLTL